MRAPRSGRIVVLMRQRWRLLHLSLEERRAGGLLVMAHMWTSSVPTLTALATGALIAGLLRTADDDGGATDLAWPLTLMAALLVADEVFTALGRAVEQYTAGRIDARVRGMVRRIALAPDGIAHLGDPEFADDAARASDVGEGRVRSPGTAAVGQLRLVFRVIAALGAAGVVASFSPLLAAWLLVTSLIMRALIRRQWIHLAEVRDSRESLKRRGEYWTELVAGPDAAKEIRLFGLHDWAVRRRTAEVREWAGAIWSTRRQILRQQGWTAGLALASSGAALLYPGLAAAHGQISLSTLGMVLVSAWGVFGISTMGHEAFDIEYGMGAVQALDRLTHAHSPDHDTQAMAAAPSPAPGDRSPAQIRLESVVFRYPGRSGPVLDGLDLHIGSGEVLALVGRNGAGKTTLIKLIGGLYRPSKGRVVIDGVDSADIPLRELRRRVAVVFQDFNQYPMSAADNIALAAPEHRDDPEGIRDAARRAGADDVIANLPDGYATPLARYRARGTELSGGQWQRIALARALFAVDHGRDILIMDEPTAHLDVEAEASFYRQVVAEVPGATVLLISHRLSTVRHADRIAFLDGGQVREQGSHEELLDRQGAYAQLFKLQAASFSDPQPNPAPSLEQESSA